MYKKIDQPSLFKVGLYEKQALSEQAVDQVYGFSMLQRFRQSKDLNQYDKTKPSAVMAVIQQRQAAADSDEEDLDKENSFAANIISKQQAVGNVSTEAVQMSKISAAVAELEQVEQKWWLQGDAEALKRDIEKKRDA